MGVLRECQGPQECSTWQHLAQVAGGERYPSLVVHAMGMDMGVLRESQGPQECSTWQHLAQVAGGERCQSLVVHAM
jgi:hypothetical protein